MTQHSSAMFCAATNFNRTPNHALRQTAPCVTASASAIVFSTCRAGAAPSVKFGAEGVDAFEFLAVMPLDSICELLGS